MPYQGRSETEILDLFHPQHAHDDCVPACLKSAIDEFCDRADLSRRVSYSILSDAADYREDLASTMNLPGMETKLSDDLRERELAMGYDRGPEVSPDYLGKLVSDDDSSFPVVALSGEWLRDDALEKPTEPGPGDWDHTVVVLAIDEEETLVYDAFQSYLLRGDNQEASIISVPSVRFQKYWSDSEPPRWVTWFYRWTKATEAQSLEDYYEP